MKYEHISIVSSVYDGALRVVNEVRKANGMRPRKTLAGGLHGNSGKCPIANSLGDGFVVIDNGKVSHPSATVKLNRTERAALARVVRLVDKYDGDKRVVLVRGAL